MAKQKNRNSKALGETEMGFHERGEGTSVMMSNISECNPHNPIKWLPLPKPNVKHTLRRSKSHSSYWNLIWQHIMAKICSSQQLIARVTGPEEVRPFLHIQWFPKIIKCKYFPQVLHHSSQDSE
jgi:hypothetical protein